MPARILIAEDDVGLLNLLALLLEGERYTVLRAGDGAEALAIAERERPDLILSDIMMPRLTGLELAATLHAREDGPTPPILLLSANRPQSLPGHTTFLAKPFDIATLVQTVAALLADVADPERAGRSGPRSAPPTAR